MDKKELLIPNLARIMVDNLNQIDGLVQKYPQAPSHMKNDGTMVTDLDLSLSKLIEDLAAAHYPGVNYYSEENYSQWKFPKIVVDPLDGTREYMIGRDEWAVSIAYFQNEDFEGDGFIYNPKRKEVFTADLSHTEFSPKEKYKGEVSRSEWEKGLYHKIDSKKFSLHPMGSIAYKLGRLSAGKIDFVVSLRPKNIWDIAGGTLLCKKAGFKFYSEGKEVTKVKPHYEAPLIWCHPSLFSELSALFERNHKYP